MVKSTFKARPEAQDARNLVPRPIKNFRKPLLADPPSIAWVWYRHCARNTRAVRVTCNVGHWYLHRHLAASTKLNLYLAAYDVQCAVFKSTPRHSRDNKEQQQVIGEVHVEARARSAPFWSFFALKIQQMPDVGVIFGFFLTTFILKICKKIMSNTF
jgi:hypothetical protein